MKRADFAELRESGAREIVYFCDNDAPGLLVPQPFSQRWGQKFRVIKLDRRWPPGWDIADPMPSELFGDSVPTEERPSLRGLMRPATWATKLAGPTGKAGRPAYKLNEAFASDWYHVTKPSVYVPRDFPEKKYDKREFDAETRPFSDVPETSRLFDADHKSHAAGLDYLPDKPPGLIALNHNTGLVLNTHVPTKIVPIKGDVTLFLDYLEGLLTDPKECHEVKRWVATLLARPGIRMEYALLMYSETQGVGKTTLAERILTPLLGPWNVSFPSEKEVTDSTFNGWVVQTRLAVINEIYSGANRKAYNVLKDKITEKFVRVNEKYLKPHQIQNWTHIYASSNSDQALKLDNSDRRWLVPQISEEKRPREFWVRLNQWLTLDGGLGKILQWAHDWLADDETRVVRPGEPAPVTSTKSEMIRNAWGRDKLLVADVLEWVKSSAEATGSVPIIVDKDMVDLIREENYGGREDKSLISDKSVRGVAKDVGWFVGKGHENRIWHKGQRGFFLSTNEQYVQMTPEALREAGLQICDVKSAYRKFVGPKPM